MCFLSELQPFSNQYLYFEIFLGITDIDTRKSVWKIAFFKLFAWGDVSVLSQRLIISNDSITQTISSIKSWIEWNRSIQHVAQLRFNDFAWISCLDELIHCNNICFRFGYTKNLWAFSIVSRQFLIDWIERDFDTTKLKECATQGKTLLMDMVD